METVLVATFAEHCQSIDQATKAGAVANIPRLLIPKIDGTPSLAQFAQHESMILGIFKLAAAVNPKAFRVAFIKIDTMYMGNFSGSSTFTGRALWAGENAANGHHIIVQAIRKCKAKGRPRGEVMKRLKAAWLGRLDKGAPSRSSPLRRSASSGEPGSGKLPQSQGSGELQAAAPSDDGSDVSEYTAALESLAKKRQVALRQKGGVAEEDESGTEAFSSEGGDQVFDESVCSEHDAEDPVAQLRKDTHQPSAASTSIRPPSAQISNAHEATICCEQVCQLWRCHEATCFSRVRASEEATFCTLRRRDLVQRSPSASEEPRFFSRIRSAQGQSYFHRRCIRRQ